MAKVIIKANNVQEEILKLVYTFRFVSTPLLTRLRKVDNTVTFRALENLYNKGLLNKKSDNTYKLMGRPASYSLSPAGVSFLKEFLEVNKKYALTMYKNAITTDTFVNQSLNILAAYVILSETYPNTFTSFTRAETIELERLFPRTLPNLYLMRNETSASRPNHYFLDILAGNQKHVIFKKLNVYLDHFESGYWEEEEYPTILLVLDNVYVEDIARKIIEDRMDSRYISDADVKFLTTTRKALFSASNTDIWSNNENVRTSL